MVRETSEKIDLIRRRMKTAQDRKKSYADRRRTDIKFEVGDMVFIKVSPLRNVFRFGSVGKLAPRFVGPFCSDPNFSACLNRTRRRTALGTGLIGTQTTEHSIAYYNNYIRVKEYNRV